MFSITQGKCNFHIKFFLFIFKIGKPWPSNIYSLFTVTRWWCSTSSNASYRDFDFWTTESINAPDDVTLSSKRYFLWQYTLLYCKKNYSITDRVHFGSLVCLFLLKTIWTVLSTPKQALTRDLCEGTCMPKYKNNRNLNFFAFTVKLLNSRWLVGSCKLVGVWYCWYTLCFFFCLWCSTC